MWILLAALTGSLICLFLWWTGWRNSRFHVDCLHSEIARLRAEATETFNRGRRRGREEVKEEIERSLALHRSMKEAEKN